MDLSPAMMKTLASEFERRTGQQIGSARSWRLEVALTPIMRTHRLGSLDAVAGRIASGADPSLSEQVVDALLNNETSFFRDPGLFAQLVNEALPPVLAARPARLLRIWSAGASTGQEAYSLAMAIAEQPALAAARLDILASDISASAVERVRGATYEQREVQRGLPVRSLLRWFEEIEEERWRVVPDLRTRVRAQRHNLLDPPPVAARFDAILCRNVLLYFPSEVRRRVLDRMAGVLAPDGILMLGAGETVLGQTERFEPHPDLRGLYRLRG